MDPASFTTLVISSAVGGAAGSLVKELAGKGAQWLIEMVAAHSPAVQEKAKSNMENFLYRLAERVERLEHEIPPEKKGIIQEAMEHPNTAFLIGNAMKSSAITDADEHHALLAELIAQRLGAGGDDMVTLIGNAACGVVNLISVRQINFLAVFAVLLDIRPQNRIEESSIPDPKKYVCDWWEERLTPLFEKIDFGRLTALDLEHLAAMGCLRIGSIRTSLEGILSNRFFDGDKFKFTAEDLKERLFYQQLKQVWELLSFSKLTSTGKLIGVLHHDRIFGTKTTIDW